MTERDISEQTNFDETPPQPVPRAGMGIASQIGFGETADESHLTKSNGHHAASQAPGAVELHPEESELPDPATIPELAPLAAGEALVTSGPLDEFDMAAGKSLNGTGGGGNGPGDGNSFDNFSEGPGEMAQDLFSHLGELRARILYSVAAVAIASLFTWHYGSVIQDWLTRPIITTLKQYKIVTESGGGLVTLNPTDAFYNYFQVTLAAAILVAAPFVLFQMWRFIEPALTRTERKYTIVLVPFSVILFFAGVALGYTVSPLFFQFFLQFQPPNTIPMFSYGDSVALLAKMLVVFGVCFQVPVVTIFLNKIGVVSRNFLIEYWRHAVVVIFVIVAVITPTWDPLTLCACAAPPCVLYGLSIWLVKWL